MALTSFDYSVASLNLSRSQTRRVVCRRRTSSAWFKKLRSLPARMRRRGKRIEALNNLFVVRLRPQRPTGWIRRVSVGRLKMPTRRHSWRQSKITTDWIDEKRTKPPATEDLEEKLKAVSIFFLLSLSTSKSCWRDVVAEIQSVVSPITSKLYAGADAPGGDDEDETHSATTTSYEGDIYIWACRRMESFFLGTQERHKIIVYMSCGTVNWKFFSFLRLPKRPQI